LTDVGDEVLEMCCRNVDANKHLRHSQSASVLVRELDWMQSDLQTGLMMMLLFLCVNVLQKCGVFVN